MRASPELVQPKCSVKDINEQNHLSESIIKCRTGTISVMAGLLEQ